VKPLVFASAEAQPMTWMHARRAVERVEVAAPADFGVMPGRISSAAERPDARARTLEAWR
jgi:hypothetical protein